MALGAIGSCACISDAEDVMIASPIRFRRAG